MSEWRTINPVYLQLRATFGDGYPPEAPPEFDPQLIDRTVRFQAPPPLEDDEY